MDKQPDFTLYYNTATKLRNQELSLLLQRLNFFLIGTAFLITGFVALMVSLTFFSVTGLQYLSYILVAAGWYLALFFAIVNYRNTIIVSDLDDYIVGLEKGYQTLRYNKPYSYIRRKVRNEYPVTHLLRNMCGQIFKIVRIEHERSGCRIAPHTWIVPLGFCLFWILVLVFTVPKYIIPISIVIVVPFIALLVARYYGRKDC